LGVYKSLRNDVIGSLVVSVAGLLPGYYATFALIDVWGRKPIQFMGFAVLTVLLAILGRVYPSPKRFRESLLEFPSDKKLAFIPVLNRTPSIRAMPRRLSRWFAWRTFSAISGPT